MPTVVTIQHEHFSFRPITSVETGTMSQHYRHFNDVGGMQFGNAKRVVSPVRSRPRSLEPPAPPQKEPWLKPYIAPNVLNAKFSGPQTGFYKHVTRSYDCSGLNDGGSCFSGAYQPGQIAVWATLVSGELTTARPMLAVLRPAICMWIIGNITVLPLLRHLHRAVRHLVPAQVIKYSDVLGWIWAKGETLQSVWSDVRSFSPRPHAGVAPPAVPPRPARAWSPPPSAAPLWQGEAEAWQRKREMEEEIRRRTAGAAALGPPPGFSLFNAVRPAAHFCVNNLHWCNSLCTILSWSHESAIHR